MIELTRPEASRMNFANEIVINESAKSHSGSTCAFHECFHVAHGDLVVSSG